MLNQPFILFFFQNQPNDYMHFPHSHTAYDIFQRGLSIEPSRQSSSSSRYRSEGSHFENGYRDTLKIQLF